MPPMTAPAAAGPLTAPAAPSVPITSDGTRFDRVFDFPTLTSGDAFRIVSGSTANGISVRGEARIEELSPTTARVWVKAGRFGFNKEAVLDVTQVDPATVRIQATEPGKAPQGGTARIVDVRPNYSEFATESGPVSGSAILQLNAAGQFVVDVDGTAMGLAAFEGLDLHLVMEKR